MASPSARCEKPCKQGLCQPRSSGHLDDGLHDGAFSGNGLGVGLVVALRLDQVDQLAGQVDVGVFQGAAGNRPRVPVSGSPMTGTPEA
jgi:hypothetical protein